MRVLIILALLALAVAVIFVMTKTPEPGTPCTQAEKGTVKFYSTGKIVECDGSAWQLKNGVRF